MPISTKTRRRYLDGLIASIVLVSGLGIFSYVAWSALLDAFRWVSHTREVELQTQKVLAEADDADDSQRDFLLTQSAADLRRYHVTASVLVGDVDQLRQLIVDNPEQQANVEALKRAVNAHNSLMETVMTLARSERQDEALDALRAEDINGGMEEIRIVIGKMMQEEQRLLGVREGILADHAQMNEVFALVMVGLYVLVVGIMLFLLWRYTRIRTLLTVCAWTKKVQHEGRWISFEEYLNKRFGIDTSHGVSPDALEKALQELNEEEAGRSTETDSKVVRNSE